MQSILPDKRFRNTVERVITEITLRQTTVIRRIGNNRNERDRFYRFLAHDSTTITRLAEDVANSFDYDKLPLPEHVLVLGDTSEINTLKQRGRRKSESDIGVLSDNETPGFMLHVNMAVNAQTGLPLSITQIQSWQRPLQKQSKKERKGEKSLSKPVVNDPTGKLRESESKKWEIGVKGSIEKLRGVSRITCIHDREDDDYQSLCNIAGMEVDFIVRGRNNRLLYTEKGAQEKQYLFEEVAKTDCAGTYTFEVAEDNRKQRKGRKATMEVRYMQARIQRPSNIYCPYPAYLDVWVIDAKEHADSVPDGEAPIHWVLITNIQVSDMETAFTIIMWYRWRWLIEQLYRILKSAGLNIEDCGLDSIEEIQKLCILALPAALNVLQLTYSEKSDQMQITSVFEAEKVALLEHLNPSLEGNTAKQKNPYPQRSIAWSKWVIARLGGWDPAESRPAGVITIFNGIKRFNEMYLGWALAKAVTNSNPINTS